MDLSMGELSELSQDLRMPFLQSLHGIPSFQQNLWVRVRGKNETPQDSSPVPENREKLCPLVGQELLTESSPGSKVESPAVTNVIPRPEKGLGVGPGPATDETPVWERIDRIRTRVGHVGDELSDRLSRVTEGMLQMKAEEVLMTALHLRSLEEGTGLAYEEVLSMVQACVEEGGGEDSCSRCSEPVNQKHCVPQLYLPGRLYWIGWEDVGEVSEEGETALGKTWKDGEGGVVRRANAKDFGSIHLSMDMGSDHIMTAYQDKLHVAVKSMGMPSGENMESNNLKEGLEGVKTNEREDLEKASKGPWDWSRLWKR
ncbi:unnamed protein product [Choristocarpus tenellus]